MWQKKNEKYKTENQMTKVVCISSGLWQKFRSLCLSLCLPLLILPLLHFPLSFPPSSCLGFPFLCIFSSLFLDFFFVYLLLASCIRCQPGSCHAHPRRDAHLFSHLQQQRHFNRKQFVEGNQLMQIVVMQHCAAINKYHYVPLIIS